MKQTKKILIITTLTIGAIIMGTVIISLHPLFRSSERVLNDVLKILPMGTHIDDVAAVVNKQSIIKNVKEMHAPIIKYDSWYVNPRHGEVPGWSSTSTSAGHVIVGYKSIKVSYKTYFNTFFAIYWGFDEDGKLIDVLVTKDLDMIELASARRTAD